MAADISPQARNMLDTLRRVGTPNEALTPLEHYVQRDSEIREAQYKSEKEDAQLHDLRAHVAGELAGAIRRAEATAAAERDQELKAVDAELARAQALPNRDLGDLDSEYLGKLQKIAIMETRQLQADIRTNSDLLLVAQINDPAELERIVTDALEGNNPGHIARVARAVEHKLSTQAVDESRTKRPGESRPAAEASLRVGDQVRQWRARESDKSPAVRKQRIIARYESRVQDMRTAVTRAADQFGLGKAVEAGLKK